MPFFRPVAYEPPVPKNPAEDPRQGYSDSEVDEYKEAFQLFDKNGDGAITAEELRQVMRSLGKLPTDEEVNEMLSGMDMDGNGSLDFSEFLRIMAKKTERGDTEKDILEAFKIFDKDGNGFINHIELYHVMVNLGEKLTPEEAYDMINEADSDGDGMINFQEFRRIMLASQPEPKTASAANSAEKPDKKKPKK